jgi:hypothetical protein
MASRLPIDCLNEIFEHLEENETTLYSCLLVNRLWCRISVRILWRNIWNFKGSEISHRFRVESSILRTLIACLPDKSRKFLFENEIISSPTFTLKSPLFNYAAFCKVLAIYNIVEIVDNVLYLEQFGKRLVLNEIFKMFTNNISSLKKLTYCYNNKYQIKFSFTNFPGLKELSELRCGSNISPDFFHQLSQISHNLQTIFIDFNDEDDEDDLNELKELISIQNNLKNLAMTAFDASWENIIPALKSQSNTITKLHLYSNDICMPLSFVSSFTNLQEVIFSFPSDDDIDDEFIKDFDKLENSNFPRLQVLKIPFQCPKSEYLIKFLENNGKTLKKLFICELESVAIPSIANFCINLQNLFVIFNHNELHLLQIIFIKCQYLESIKIWCGEGYLTEKEVLEVVANHAPNSFRELKIYNVDLNLEFVSSKDLESFFISWEKRVPKKLLSLIIIKREEDCNLLLNEESMKIVEKYVNLGVIQFRTKLYDDEEVEEVYEFF